MLVIPDATKKRRATPVNTSNLKSGLVPKRCRRTCFVFCFQVLFKTFLSEITNMFPNLISIFLCLKNRGYTTPEMTGTSGSMLHTLFVHSTAFFPQGVQMEYRRAFSSAWSSRLSTSSLATATATRSRRSTVPVHGATCTPSALTWRSSTLRFTGLHLRPRRPKRPQRSCCALEPCVFRTEASWFSHCPAGPFSPSPKVSGLFPAALSQDASILNSRSGGGVGVVHRCSEEAARRCVVDRA